VRAWNGRVQERMKRTVWNTGGCTSWYLDAGGRNTTIWPGTPSEFRRATRRVDLAEYEVLRAPATVKNDAKSEKQDEKRTGDLQAGETRQEPVETGRI